MIITSWWWGPINPFSTQLLKVANFLSCHQIWVGDLQVNGCPTPLPPGLAARHLLIIIIIWIISQFTHWSLSKYSSCSGFFPKVACIIIIINNIGSLICIYFEKYIYTFLKSVEELPKNALAKCLTQHFSMGELSLKGLKI